MTRIFQEDGSCIPVTKCQALPLLVTQINQQHNSAKDTSVQLAYGTKKKPNRTIASKLKKLKIKTSPAHFVEFTLRAEKSPELGSEVAFDSVFEIGETVDVIGVSKGRGFAGVIKRHGFHRQPVTRGQSDRTRAPGAIGAQTPGKVLKGKKMPGHFGNKQVTVQNLKIITYDQQTHIATIKGDLPGHKNGWLIVRKKKEFSKK